jgi:uncharacterized protein (TIGR01777 family)
MRIVVTGSSGLIGSSLVPALRRDGHDVVRLVRRPPQAPDEAQWWPSEQRVEPSTLEGADAVVHLAGASIAGRPWTSSYRQTILRSRVDGTTALAQAMTRLPRPPRVWLSASGVNYYGDTGEQPVDETADKGQGFLADVTEAWESATEPAVAAGVRVVTMRSGVVLAADDGALGKVLPLFKLGLGGRLGSGQQWMSWISLPDEVAAMRFLLEADDVTGPVNLVAPEPVRNADYTDAIGRALHRPTVVAAPGFALRLALRDLAEEALLISLRVQPARLEKAGFTFTHPHIDEAVSAVL